MLTGETKVEFIDRLKYKNNIGIYKIVNNINGKTYIGQTKEGFQRRYYLHDWKLRNNIHDNFHLQSSFNKYGDTHFTFEIVEIIDDVKLLDEREKYWIQYYRKICKCYNVQDGGQPESLHRYITDEQRKYVGELNRQRMLGSKLSEETKRKMSESHKGKRIYRKNDLLNDEQVKQIKQMLIKGYSTYEIYTSLNVPYKAVNGILSSNTYKSIKVEGWEDFYNTRKRQKGKPISSKHAPKGGQLNEEMIHKIKEVYNSNHNISKTAKILGISRSSVYKYK